VNPFITPIVSPGGGGGGGGGGRILIEFGSGEFLNQGGSFDVSGGAGGPGIPITPAGYPGQPGAAGDISVVPEPPALWLLAAEGLILWCYTWGRRWRANEMRSPQGRWPCSATDGFGPQRGV
jgi:hypothetical protein